MYQINNTRENFIKQIYQKQLICFGAGRFLKNIKGFLESEHLCIAHLIDNNKDKWGTRIDNSVIEDPCILSGCSGEEYVILISSKRYANEIKEQIEKDFPNKFMIFKWPLETEEYREFDDKIWHERIYKPCETLYNKIALVFNEEEREAYLSKKKELLSDKEKVILPRTPLMITTRCTLRCKECSNLMPYYEHPGDYDADEIIGWIKNICEAVDEWICLELVGGEPFLYRNLAKILRYTLGEEKIQQVEFTSNASVMPDQEMLELLSNRKVHIKISQYPGLIDPSRFMELLGKYGIWYELMENMRWTKTGSLTSRGRTVVELQSQYLNCSQAKVCRTILNGKLYVCSKAASLMELGYLDDLEMVDLTDKDNLRKNIWQFLRLPYSDACNYCDIASADEEIVEPAIQAERKI